MPQALRLDLVPPSPAQFKRLYEATGWSLVTHDEAFFARALTGCWFVASAHLDGQIVGMTRVISDGVMHAFITEMIIEESHRGQSVGAALVSFVVDEIRGRGVDDIQLFAAAGRAPFYERNGFVRRPDDAPGMRWVGPS